MPASRANKQGEVLNRRINSRQRNVLVLGEKELKLCMRITNTARESHSAQCKGGLRFMTNV